MMGFCRVFSRKGDGTVIPPYLNGSDEVAIVSPSFSVDSKKIEDAVRVLESWGLKTRLGDHLFLSDGPFAGSDKQRLEDIQKMLNAREIKAILFARGGYGAIRIVDKIDFSVLRKNPKWLVGFSDITVFHLWLGKKLGMATIHGEMPVNFGNSDKTPETMETLRDALFGGLSRIGWQGNVLRPAEARGEIIGGNLSLVYSLVGTAGDIETRGKILFLEDVGEQYYHIDRMLVSLKLAGKLDQLSGLIVGSFNKMEETTVPWGKSIEDIVSSITKEYGYPVYFNFPGGHAKDNRAFYLGRRARLLPGNIMKFD